MKYNFIVLLGGPFFPHSPLRTRVSDSFVSFLRSRVTRVIKINADEKLSTGLLSKSWKGKCGSPERVTGSSSISAFILSPPTSISVFRKRESVPFDTTQ